jgi:hypothetical protein
MADRRGEEEAAHFCLQQAPNVLFFARTPGDPRGLKVRAEPVENVLCDM